MKKLLNQGIGVVKVVASTCVLATALVACTSTPKPPTEALQAAELSIANAEQARVADYASPELGAAREKLTEARVAATEKDMLRAARLAEQARANAELATARAQAAKAKEVNESLRKNIDDLQQELQRQSGGAL